MDALAQLRDPGAAFPLNAGNCAVARRSLCSNERCWSQSAAFACVWPYGSCGSDDFPRLFLSAKLAEFHCPGATVVVVRNGRILAAKGYGYAELANKTPVDPEKTRFYVASVSKLFVATAVVQLADRGALRLDQDVNHYLKHTRLDNNYPPACHCSQSAHPHCWSRRSFECDGRHSAACLPTGRSNQLYQLRIRSCGRDRRRRERAPLRRVCRDSSCVPPPASAPDLARGYDFDEGKFEPAESPMDQVVPSGSLVSTATDMARFMIAHLQNGQDGEA